MTRPISTKVITDPHTGNTITAPAHLVARERITASDVRQHGSFAAAREVKWGLGHG